MNERKFIERETAPREVGAGSGKWLEGPPKEALVVVLSVARGEPCLVWAGTSCLAPGGRGASRRRQSSWPGRTCGVSGVWAEIVSLQLAWLRAAVSQVRAAA